MSIGAYEPGPGTRENEDEKRATADLNDEEVSCSFDMIRGLYEPGGG